MTSLLLELIVKAQTGDKNALEQIIMELTDKLSIINDLKDDIEEIREYVSIKKIISVMAS